MHHGDKDDVVPLKASRQMVDALNRAGAPEVNFTKYPNVMHDSWTAAYGDIEIYQWMLNHKRSAKGDEKIVPEANKITL